MAGGGFQRLVEKYVFNPPVRWALSAGVAPRAFALLETVGRRSGRRRVTPVGNGFVGDGVFWLVSEHGTRSAYVQNLVANPGVRIKIGRRWYQGRAVVVEGDDALARRRVIDAGNGAIGRADGVIFRASASRPATIRIDLDMD